MKFRILAGFHIGAGPSGPDHLYKLGDIVESPQDLERVFNSRDSRKFERIHEDQPATPPVGPAVGIKGYLARLEAMSSEDLVALAKDEDIDIHGAKGKVDILAKIKRGLLSPAAMA